MSEHNPNHNQPIDERTLDRAAQAQQTQEGMLGDESRIKILSPGMMVFKRFVRNRLAITGMIILVFMFAFSFIGGLLAPYRQDETFFSTVMMLNDYAGATRNSELRFTVAEGENFDRGANARFVLAKNSKEPSFVSGNRHFTYVERSDSLYDIYELQPMVKVSSHKVLISYTPVGSFNVSPAFKAAFEPAFKANEDSFELDGETYHIIRDGREVTVGQNKPVALASMNIFTAATKADEALVNSYAFREAAEHAIAAGESSFTANDVAYDLREEEGSHQIRRADSANGEIFAVVSDMIVNAIAPDIFLSLDFRSAAVDAISERQDRFVHNDITYMINLVHQTYVIKTQTQTHVFDMYHRPDSKHLLGTDQNGMDVLTRLMYGGRISLMVGFVVVILEILIGVIIGGISGYFGGWVDTLLMRFIDLFNCIPTWPILIITGSVMDTLEMNPYVRVYLLMFILGLLGWTGIARVVRGQILALREQDFMVATEATGIRVSRRIGKHLVPNVMPLLIVQATMGLGGIILTEATLSFLGLGIKHPLASWGSIINAASNPYVMTNYWFIWVPAGLLILLTVLGFNFVGDGLRDAFDPKMKR